jgi:tRNA 5-methylaminomethyl-2-thiouridine biosynthesis bifunctional protein
LGFGTGLNLLSTVSCLEESNDGQIEISYYSVEKHPLSAKEISEIIAEYSQNFLEIYYTFLEKYDKLFSNIKEGFNFDVWFFKKIKVNFNLYFGDVNCFLDELCTKIDSWYLDGYSPEKNPDMWSREVCEKLYDSSRINTTAATYTAAGIVKRNLRAAGFFVKRMKGFGIKRHKLFIEKR